MNKLWVKMTLGVFLIITLLYTSKILIAANELIPQETDVSVSVNPENPEPYQDVTIKLNSYSTDLNKSMIEWQNGSNIVLSGYGKTSYSFKTLGPNSITILDVTISIPGSIESITKRIAINPSEVQLIWEGVDSYTPPFYRGKSFPSAEGMIKVVAIPNTNTIKQGKGNVTYSWKTGDNAVLGASGYNKDSYVFKNSEFNRVEKVTVTAQSINGQYSATNTIEVPIVSPKIIFYKRSPSEGVLYNQAIVNESYMTEDEATIVAEPYFLALKGNEDNFVYKWKINGKDIDTPSKKTELTIRPASRGGYATIDVVYENLNTLYQKVSGSLKLTL